ncbi:hypothetical protein ERJ75_001341000 [Trypanosoma vivax]|uniref:Uncharacterized protein n=1 Tax=Trypanosoma vivax (strain Y486) TaxID=1055687 RepID=G0U606_TRYVY|nr:hypothetical protein ERJ75_001341000 [Trypanosoma vivax]CCC51307.1 conserved hypothetical protein [Trypanosoma vivax Y486]
MGVGTAVRQRSVAAARQWRRVPFQRLRRQLVTPYVMEVRLPLEPAMGKAAEKPPLLPTINIRVETNKEAILHWCQLEYFGHVHNPETAGSESAGGSAVVCIHSGLPRPLGCPYTLSAEAGHFADTVRRAEAQRVRQGEEMVEGPHPTRWLTQPLLDGFISRRVAAHVGLFNDNMPQTLELARRLKVSLMPSDMSPYYFANELLSTWGLFGDIDIDNASAAGDSVNRVIQLAHASCVASNTRSVWLNGASLCNGKGDAVIILGPRRSGKTTLALHCLSEHPSTLKLIGLENVHVGQTGAPRHLRLPDTEPLALLMGVPASAKVGIGTLIGTLRANPHLTKAAHTFSPPLSTVQSILRNDEKTIWGMGHQYPVNISEAFGPRRWSPTWLGKVRGVVLLNWDIVELARATSTSCTQIVEWKGKEGFLKLQDMAAQSGHTSLFRGHYLLRSIYNEMEATQRLEENLHFSIGRGPPVFEIRGAVHFDAGVKLIHRLLGE